MDRTFPRAGEQAREVRGIGREVGHVRTEMDLAELPGDLLEAAGLGTSPHECEILSQPVECPAGAVRPEAFCREPCRPDEAAQGGLAQEQHQYAVAEDIRPAHTP